MDDTEKCLHKRDYNENTLSCFKQVLFEASWNSVENLKQINHVMNFLKFLQYIMANIFLEEKSK